MLQNLEEKYHDLLAEGKSEEAAFNIAVAGIGDLSGLIEELNRDNHPSNCVPVGRLHKQRSALLVSIAVALYILCVIPCILLDHGPIGPVLMFLMVAIATGLLVYNGMTKTSYQKQADTMVEDFKQWKVQKSNNRQLLHAVSAALWALTIALYFIISFATMAWFITWVIFLLAFAVNAILKAVFDLQEMKR